MPLAAAPLSLPNYPYLFVLPDGRVFYAGPSNPTRTLEVEPQTWTPVGNSPIGGGSAVMYAPGQVLKSGGGDPATARAVIIDMSQESPAWREVSPMAFPRRRHNLTVLPDGKVLVTGGTQVGNEEAQAVYAAELWDPVSESWTTLASMHVARMYHSTALLLPDGRVHSAGGNGKLNAELYAPPYLFAGPPPEIAAAPARLAYGASFEVATPEAASIAAGGWCGGPTVDAPCDVRWSPPSQQLTRLRVAPQLQAQDREGHDSVLVDRCTWCMLV
jgi:hypothetical protein